MTVRFPKYYSRFACIMGACEDSCCVGWDILIDEATLEKYEKLPGKPGERIRKEVYRSEDGCAYIRTDSGRCPFLNERGLCDIILESSEKMLSDICKRHPRYLTRVDGFCEGGIGLCCLSAAELILGAKECEFKTKAFRL